MPSAMDITGWTPTGAMRLVAGRFGFRRVEALWKHRDGAAEWRRYDGDIPLDRLFAPPAKSAPSNAEEDAA